MYPWVALFFEYYTMPLASHSYSPHIMKAGTVGGTLLVIIIQIQQAEFIKTAILASIGTSVSFLSNHCVEMDIEEGEAHVRNEKKALRPFFFFI
jgi:hypothetical protein